MMIVCLVEMKVSRGLPWCVGRRSLRCSTREAAGKSVNMLHNCNSQSTAF